jgi:serine/threonine protein kinase, bacterial
MKKFLSKLGLGSDPFKDKPIFAGYYLLESLGEGGFGDVYKAIKTDEVDAGRFVALKKLHETHGDEEKNRFRREVDILTSLSHPNVVEIFEGGEEEDVLFFTMEVLEGRDLEKFVGKQKQKLSTTASMVRQIAGGLYSAHVKGLVHRDVKPSNIFVCRDGSLKVIDFGLAKDPQATVKVTMQNCLPGSPMYMPPEVMPLLQGQVDEFELTPAYDQFALGTIVFEMLTGGERPFVSDFQFPAGSHDLSSMGFRSLKSVGEFGVDKPEALDPVLHRAMAPELGDRFETIVEFAEALEEAIR